MVVLASGSPEEYDDETVVDEMKAKIAAKTLADRTYDGLSPLGFSPKPVGPVQAQ